MDADLLTTVAIPAVVKFMELVNKKDWASASKIVAAVLTGAVAGYFELWGLTLASGALAGLMASGLVTIAGYAGAKANVDKIEKVEVSP